MRYRPLKWGETRGRSRGQVEGSLGGWPTLFVGVLCAVIMHSTSFAPCTSEVEVGFLVFLYLVYNLNAQLL